MSGSEEAITLIVRRTIRATPERLFRAWTNAGQLTKWWGPAGVECPEAEVDLRVGGGYRIVNRLPNGELVEISGEFIEIDAPQRLVYSWSLGAPPSNERVTVRFEARDAATEVIVVHERISTEAARDEHERGWSGCLHGLADYVARTVSV